VRISEQTGTSDARAVIPNPDGRLHPGQFVRVTLSGATRPAAVLVPQRAVLDGPQGKFVYVAAKSAEGKDVALPRPVTVGEWVDLGGQPQWIIEQGLADMASTARDAEERARFELLRTYHTSSSEVGKVASNADAKHLVLSHVLRSQGDQSAFDTDIEPDYGGELTLGEDLMTFEVGR